jgi:hypothetical protein
MAVVDTKYITAANFYSVVGYAGSNFPGTVSETSGGSQDNNLDDLYSGADMYSFYSGSGYLNLYIDDNSNNVTNSGWDFVKIGTASFNRTDATYTQNSPSTGRDNWRWTVTSNPFVHGNTYAISFETNITPDTTPNAYTFTDVTSASPSNNYDTYVQITGINTATSVARTSGSGSFQVSSSTSTPGYFQTSNTTIQNNQYLHVKQTASSSLSTAVSTAMIVGGVSDTWTVTTSATAPAAYGMEVYDTNGNPRMSMEKRQARIHGRVSGTGNGSSFNQSYTGFGVGGLGQWHAVNVKSNSNYYVDPSASSTNNIYLRRADVRTSNASYQILTGDEDYDIIVFRY